MPWSAVEMLDRQHRRVDIPAHARTARNGPLQKRLKEDLCRIVCHVSLTTQSVKGLSQTELNYTYVFLPFFDITGHVESH